MTALLRYPREIAIGALIVALGTMTALYVAARDRELIEHDRAEQALAALAPMQEDVDASTAAREAVERAYVAQGLELEARDAQNQQDSREANEERREAEVVVVATGASVDATLDSLAASPLTADVADTLRAQIGAERQARQREREAQDRQLMAAANDARLWRLQYEREHELRLAVEVERDEYAVALDAALRAVASRIPGESWWDSTTGKLVTHGAVAYVSYKVGER